jgi:N-acetylglucosaminyl-diphospho-decaprenol L-rhamnosyltransferase
VTQSSIQGKTSVIIVGWQVRDLLRDCLASIAAYEDRTHLEVLVVDNASTDGTAAMVKAKFPWVRLITLDHNPGFAAGNNAGLRHATGDICVLLNPDTEIAGPALTTLAGYLRAHPKVGAAGPRLLNPDGTLQTAGYAMPTLFQLWYDLVPWPRRLYNSRRNGRYPDAPDDRPYDVGFPLGACLAIPRDLFSVVGLLDEAYGMYMEEIDFCARLHGAGYAVRIVPMVTVTHHGGQSTGQAPEAMFLALHRARRCFFARFYSPRWNRAAQWVTQAGLIAAAARVFFMYRRGALPWNACRMQVRRYGRAWRLWQGGE